LFTIKASVAPALPSRTVDTDSTASPSQQATRTFEADMTYLNT
jgi:hypothetical protein